MSIGYVNEDAFTVAVNIQVQQRVVVLELADVGGLADLEVDIQFFAAFLCDSDVGGGTWTYR